MHTPERAAAAAAGLDTGERVVAELQAARAVTHARWEAEEKAHEAEQFDFDEKVRCEAEEQEKAQCEAKEQEKAQCEAEEWENARREAEERENARHEAEVRENAQREAEEQEKARCEAEEQEKVQREAEKVQTGSQETGIAHLSFSQLLPSQAAGQPKRKRQRQMCNLHGDGSIRKENCVQCSPCACPPPSQKRKGTCAICGAGGSFCCKKDDGTWQWKKYCKTHKSK